ncbi:MAG: hypothetical protein AB8G15_03645 [Saprospiraceae bacterium]
MQYHPQKKEKRTDKEDAQQQSAKVSTKQFADKRSSATTQRKLNEAANNSSQVNQLKAYQQQANADQPTNAIPSSEASHKKIIQAKLSSGTTNNTVIQRIEGEGDDPPKKKDTTIGTQVLKQGATTGFAEKTGTAVASVVDSSLVKHPTPIINHLNQAGTGAAIVGDAGGLLTGGLQIHSGATAEHLSKKERAKDVTTGVLSTTATAAKTGLDTAHLITHVSALAPPAALLGAVTGGVEAIKGGIDAHAATKLKTTLQTTSTATKTSLGHDALSALEIGASEKQREAVIGATLGGGKLVTGALLAALGFAHAGPIGIAVSAAILGALGVGALGKFAKQRYDQKKLGMELVDNEYNTLTQRHQVWQLQINHLESMLESATTTLSATRLAFEGIDRRIQITGAMADKGVLALLEAQRTKLRNRVQVAEQDYTEIYNARISLYGAEPKIAPRYDRTRIKGHFRGYGDVFREELSEKALAAAVVLHGLIQKAWKYQLGSLKFEISRCDYKMGMRGLSQQQLSALQSKKTSLRIDLLYGKGDLTGARVGPAINEEVLKIMKNMGVNYDRTKGKPSVADLHKVINKNLASYSYK